MFMTNAANKILFNAWATGLKSLERHVNVPFILHLVVNPEQQLRVGVDSGLER